MSDYRPTSEWNAASLWLTKMEGRFIQAEDASISLNGSKWFHTLNVIKKNLKDDMNDKEKIYIEEHKNKCNALLSKRCNNRKYYSYISTETYTALEEYEEFLRDIYKKAGYKSKVKDDPRFAI